MKTDLFSIGGLTVHGYGFMIGIGFILAMLLGEYRAKKSGLREESIIDITIIAGLTGFLGAKLLYIIVEFDTFVKNPKAVLGSSGFVVYGGIIAGVLCCMLYCKIKKLNFLEYFDLVMPEIALAQAFGRLGCFLAGCCYGRETTSHFSVVFPAGSQAPAGVSLIPTQLISAGANFIHMIILLVIAYNFSYTAGKNREKMDADSDGNNKSAHRNHGYLPAGDIGYIYMILYGIGRFLIEFLRNDYRGAVGFLSTSQFISIFFVICGTGLIIFNTVRKQ